MSAPKYHDNLLTTIFEANNLFEVEEKKIEEMLKQVAKENRFYSKCGRGVAQMTPSHLSGKWEGDECTLDVDVNGMEFVARGNFTKQTNPLTGGLGGLLHSGQSSMVVYKEEWRVEYRGQIHGRTVEAHVGRELIDDSRTLLSSIVNSILFCSYCPAMRTTLKPWNARGNSKQNGTS